MCRICEIEALMLRIPFYWRRPEDRDLSMKIVGECTFIYIYTL
jgi:hypothetical protein